MSKLVLGKKDYSSIIIRESCYNILHFETPFGYNTPTLPLFFQRRCKFSKQLVHAILCRLVRESCHLESFL